MAFSFLSCVAVELSPAFAPFQCGSHSSFGLPSKASCQILGSTPEGVFYTTHEGVNYWAELIASPNRNLVPTSSTHQVAVWKLFCAPTSPAELISTLLPGCNPLTGGAYVNCLVGGYLAQVCQKTYDLLVVLFPHFGVEKLVHLVGVEASTTHCDCPNSNTKRSREHRSIIYAKNFLTTFLGGAIPGLCTEVLTGTGSIGGKWASQNFTVNLAPGVKELHVTQDWSTAQYMVVSPSLGSMMDSFSPELKLAGVTLPAFRSFLQRELPRYWAEHLALVAQLQTLEDQGFEENVEYVFDESINVKREGWKYLLIDGDFFPTNANGLTTMPAGVVVLSPVVHQSGMRGGSYTWKLSIPADATIEEIYEDGYPGDDTLRSRGYICVEGVWALPTSTEAPKGAMSGMFGGLKL